MSEGTAREIVARAVSDELRERLAKVLFESPVAWKGGVIVPSWDRCTDERWKESTRQAVDAVLAALTEAGALAPAGLTASERECLLRWCDTKDRHFQFNELQFVTEREVALIRKALVAPAADAATGAPS